MKDPTTCPECEREFDAFELYGWQVPCPHCGELLDIFPDSDVWLDTIMGMVGIGGLNGLSGGVMRNIKWIADLLRSK